MPIPVALLEDKPKHEGLGEVKDYYTIDAKDKELVSMIDRQIAGATGEHEKWKKEGKRNERYYLADQVTHLNLRWYQSRIIQNRIYMGVETMVPIITTKPAEPVISIHDDNEEDSEGSKNFLDKLEKVLLDKYSSVDYPQQKLFEMIARHLLLYKIGVPKIMWDETIDDYLVEFVHPHKIVFGTDGHYSQDIWLAQWLEKPLRDLIKMFPEKEHDILANLFPGSKVTMEQFGGTMVGFWEYWSADGSYVVWKMRDVVLQKKRNGYIKWTDDGEFDKENNHFDYPHKPLMFLNSQNLGKHIWDDTSPVSQAIPLQDGINYMQRIITDTARDQGILVGAQEAIDRGELWKYTGNPNTKLSVKGGDPTRALYRLPPKQLERFVMDNLTHLENAMDNIMGIHSTTRGERSKAPTLGQDLLYKESDYGRIDQIVRGIERTATEIYNWEIQMMLVKYKERHYQRILGKKKGSELFKQLKQYNKRGIKILVKPGSTLPTDKVSQRQEALDLAKMNRIADIDLFERMDLPKPMEMAKNLYMQQSDPLMLYPDLEKEIEKRKASQPPETAQAVQGQPLPTAAGLPPQAGIQGQPLTNGIAPQAGIPQAGLPPAAAAPPPQAAAPQEQIGTEHTQALLAGQQVPPFEGIPPEQYEDHMMKEFTFMSTPEFGQIDQQIQALYANHALQERELLKTNNANV